MPGSFYYIENDQDAPKKMTDKLFEALDQTLAEQGTKLVLNHNEEEYQRILFDSNVEFAEFDQDDPKPNLQIIGHRVYAQTIVETSKIPGLSGYIKHD